MLKFFLTAVAIVIALSGLSLMVARMLGAPPPPKPKSRKRPRRD